MAHQFVGITDLQLDFFRDEEKRKVSATRLKSKDIFLEQQFELESVLNPDRKFRLYRRHHPTLTTVFSVGLAHCIGGEWLTLCRYNGSYHPHRNHIERDRLVNVCHIHMATQRYIENAAHPDGYAAQTTKYSSIDGAFKSILIDCNITGVLSSGDADPFSQNLAFHDHA